jgi:hypothetical protein
MRVKCDFCKKEFFAAPYLFNHAVKKEHHPVECYDELMAKCDAMFLCVFCGQTFVKNFSREVTNIDIERIAFGGRSNENGE